MSEKRSNIKKTILVRVRFLYALFLLVGLAIAGRIVYIQYGPEGVDLRAKAQIRSFERVPIEADRGSILARDGRVLAISIPTYEIRLDFAANGLQDTTFNNNVDSLAIRLSRFFGDRSTAQYKSMLVNARANRGKNRYKLISPRRVTYVELSEIKKFPIFRLGQNKGGFITEKINKRELPNGSLARRTIGIIKDSTGIIGIEEAFNHHLQGVDGNELRVKISGSFRVPVPDSENVEPKNGIDVRTTIDIDVQDIAESALKRQLELGNALWGTVVLMEVETGEILAMSNLTNHKNGNIYEDYNYAIGKRMEPGSTFKLATLMALLDDGKMSLEDMIDCENGRTKVGGAIITDDHKEGVISLREVFEVSSNIGFAKSVYEKFKDNPNRFVDYISDLGFDKPLEMQITSESGNPIVKRKGGEGWDGFTLAKMSYGYALEVTPMHTLMLYNAVANNGRMVRPKLVSELSEYGIPVRSYQTETVSKSICSTKTLADVRSALEGVVDEGTARALKNPYYKVAAKTGTSQVALGRRGYVDEYGGRYYLATMVGYYPADKPKYSCIVAISTYYGRGSMNTYYGASLAGPVFRAIADRVYAKDLTLQPSVSEGKEPLGEVVMIKGGETKEIKEVANRLKLPLYSRGIKEPWSVAKPDSVTLHLQGVEIIPGHVPLVVGMGLKEAIYILENQGLRVTFSGKGKVVSQSKQPGEQALRGQAIHITLR